MTPISSYLIPLPYTVAIFASEQSINGISGFGNQGNLFGTVYAISDSTYKILVGDSVGFRPTNAMLVTIATDTYYLVDQTDVKFIQVPPIAPP